MTIPAWPVDLPQEILMKDYGENIPKILIRTPMGAGPAKVRRVTGMNSRFVNVGLWLTKAQVEIFDAFVMTTLLGGTLHFTWTHPRTEATIDCRIVCDQENAPSYGEASGDLIKISFTLEILP
jgi:phage-related protein